MTYNGYTNWETWNVAMWIGNDALLYRLAKRANSYSQFIETIKVYSQGPCTPDGVYWASKKVKRKEITEVIKEFKN